MKCGEENGERKYSVMTFRWEQKLACISGAEKELLFLEHNEQGGSFFKQRSCGIFECLFRILGYIINLIVRL